MSFPSEPVPLVRAFCEAWSRRDPQELSAYFTADAVYHNIPMEAVRGGAISGWLARFCAQCTAAEFEILQIVAAGPLVMTERIDRFELAGKRIELPVAGVFELRDGRIGAWRDYFDLGTWTRQAAG
jgi:limonene-1,2-epoxide hydrolase